MLPYLNYLHTRATNSFRKILKSDSMSNLSCHRICIVQLSKRMGAWVKFGVFLYLFFAYGFFTVALFVKVIDIVASIASWTDYP